MYEIHENSGVYFLFLDTKQYAGNFFSKKHYQYVVQPPAKVSAPRRFPMQSLSFKLAKLSNILHLKNVKNDTSKIEISKTVDFQEKLFWQKLFI